MSIESPLQDYSYDRELPLADVQHADLREVIAEAGEQLLSIGDVDRDWQLRGIPLFKRFMPQVFFNKIGESFRYVDLGLNYKPNNLNDEPEFSLMFHGSPLSTFAMVHSSANERFVIQREKELASIDDVASNETMPDINRDELVMFLLGVLRIEPKLQLAELERYQEVGLSAALESLTDRISDRKFAKHEVIEDSAEIAFAIDEFPLELKVSKSRTSPLADTNIGYSLRAETTMQVQEDGIGEAKTFEKELSYAFINSEALEGPSTSARMHLGALAVRKPGEAVPAWLLSLVENSKQVLEDKYPESMLTAARLILSATMPR